MDNLFFTNSVALNIHVFNDGVTKEKIEKVIPQNFKGKDIFIKFFLTYDGIFFKEGAIVSTEFFHKDEDEYYELEIESIYGIDQIQNMWEAIKEQSEQVMKFMENHIPFADDAGGNHFFIEIPTGIIKYVSWEYGIQEGLMSVADNFKDFLLEIKPFDR